MTSKRIFKKLLMVVAPGEGNWVSFLSTPSPIPASFIFFSTYNHLCL